jgi:hypothetical protein
MGIVEVLPRRPSDRHVCLETTELRDGNAVVRGAHLRRPDGCDGGFNCFTGCALGDRYRALVLEVAAGVREALAPWKPIASTSKHPAIQQDSMSLISGIAGLKISHATHESMKTLIDEYISPLVHQYYDPWCPPVKFKYHFARSIYSPTEDARGHVGVWHWDGGGKGQIKVTMYLQDVDHEHACFTILRHNETGEPFVMDGSRLWGVQSAPIPVPREWISELFERGYRPHCVSGPAGTFYLFAPNAIHRATRPKPGNSRLVVHITYSQAKVTNRENGRCPQPSSAGPYLARGGGR